MHVLLPAVALIVLAFMVGLALRRMAAEARRRVWLALVWITAPILPVLYIRQMAADDFVHIRYLYLSTIGLALLVATLVSKLPRVERKIFGRSATQVICAVMLVAIPALATSRVQLHWANNFALFEHAARIAPRIPALTNYAIELGEH